MSPKWMNSGIRRWFLVVLVVSLLMLANAGYLAGVTLAQWSTGESLENLFYQYQFLLHLVLGLLLVLPFLVFAIRHARAAWHHRNRSAVQRGLVLLSVAVLLLVSGFALVRIEGFAIRDPLWRNISYWAHLLTALGVPCLFVLHRRSGPMIAPAAKRKALVTVFGLFLALLGLHALERDDADDDSDIVDRAEFVPTLASTKDGRHIPPERLMGSEYCAQCHQDAYTGWQHSVHRFSSFNNPAYFASLRETRDVLTARDGNPLASRFCAGCHDPVMLFSGRFDTVDMHQWQDPMTIKDPVVTAGITCTVCHSVTAIESPRGNADYHIEAPRHYPFANSEYAPLRWINRQLVKAKPAFHKRTFLKPLHRTAEFCGTCHKVHLPEALNDYKWLRGQNHYDTFLLSGVSGHGVESFYYPPKARINCAECHMPAQASGDFAARNLDDRPGLDIHNHDFAAANTAIPALFDLGADAIAARERFLRDSVRLDVFGLRPVDAPESELVAPLASVPASVQPGRRYILDVVLRTLKLGHPLTQGTADSNELWVELTVRHKGQILATSGARDPQGHVDPWSHFVNAYVIDRNGKKVDRRNVQDIFHTLYNNQIPPGAADVVHYALDIPANLQGEIEINARLLYRKFDANYQRYFTPKSRAMIELPIVEMAADQLRLPLAADSVDTPGFVSNPKKPAEWERWNDYGIGLFRKRGNGELRLAERAFAKVESLGKADGALNLARVYVREGRLAEADAALARAAKHQEPSWPWSVLWLTAQINHQNGETRAAIGNLQTLLATDFAEAKARGFDFSKDYRAINLMGELLFEEARRPDNAASKARLLDQAVATFDRTLVLDPENLTAHYALSQIHALAGRAVLAENHRVLHARYKPDDNAIERAASLHRQSNPAANLASEAVVVYPLKPPLVPVQVAHE